MSTPSSSKRPLSPHLQIYKPQLTSMLSIAHRASGAALCAGGVLLMFGVLALADGYESWQRFREFVGAGFGRLLVIAFGLALIYHWLNGIRHLFWDAGYGLDIKQTYASGKIVMLAFLVLSAVVLWLGFGGEV
jgi:succinate dehydrogenase / fumarate reductase, cytochrome b subunit